MAPATVRTATPEDVEEILRIQSATWRLAYAELVPPAAIERLNGDAARRAWLDAVRAGVAHHVLVATEGEWTVGFCAAAAGAEGGEIGTLLVEPRWGRRGHGGRLLAAATEALRADGAALGVAWVAEQDLASRHFYAKVAGWATDGAVRVLDTGDREIREVRLTGRL